MSRRRADKWFLGIVLVLVFAGLAIFTSASLGLLARASADPVAVTAKQFFVGGFLGFIGMILVSRIDYRLLKKHSLALFIAGLVLTAAVFIPALGFSHGGATRWLDLGITTFQPGELLKLGFVIYFAAYLASVRQKVEHFEYGLLPMGIMLALGGGLLLAQPDMGTLVVVVVTALGMFLAAGGQWKHFGVAVLVITLLGGAFLMTKPYALDRVLTFVDPGKDPLGSGYQIRQSLIAIGSGEITGRGFGQSVQKFEYLPEPTGDSIFAVAAEEFGFIGSVGLIGLFLLFAWRGLYIARHSPTRFGGLLVVGLVILIVFQSFVNMAAMLGIVPLTGMPLIFVSQGGTALFLTMIEVGIILSISKYQRT